MLTLSLEWNCYAMVGSGADMFMPAVRMVFGLALTFAPFALVVMVALLMGPLFKTFFKGSGYRTTCRSLNLKPYLTISCYVTATHEEITVGFVET